MGSFVVLDKTEFSLKLKRLCQGQNFFYAWKRGEKPQAFIPVKVEDKGSGNILFYFSAKTQFDFPLGQELLFHFMQNSVQYFSCGIFKKINDDLSLEITGEVFKREKRKNERLLAFPHHQVFAYFSLGKETPAENVISLDKSFDKKKDIFEKFLKRDSIHLGMSGFRILDISQNGFSFTASKNERNYFSEGKSYQVQLQFNGQIFSELEVRVIHAVDYIDPRYSHISMFKLGCEVIKNDEMLIDKISRLLGEESKKVEVSSEFENFFK